MPVSCIGSRLLAVRVLVLKLIPVFYPRDGSGAYPDSLDAVTIMDGVTSGIVVLDCMGMKSP